MHDHQPLFKAKSQFPLFPSRLQMMVEQGVNLHSQFNLHFLRQSPQSGPPCSLGIPHSSPPGSSWPCSGSGRGKGDGAVKTSLAKWLRVFVTSLGEFYPLQPHQANSSISSSPHTRLPIPLNIYYEKNFVFYNWLSSPTTTSFTFSHIMELWPMKDFLISLMSDVLHLNLFSW